MLTRTVLCAIPLAALRTLMALAFLATWSFEGQAQTRDIRVFADVSLRNALDEIHDLFLYDNAFNVAVTYAASSELARQIENATPADVFIADDPASMDDLAERKLIATDTRADVVGNKLVLIARADSKVALAIGPDFPLAQALGDGRLAMADPSSSAGAGRYGKAALESLGVWASVAGKVAPAEDVRAALISVSQGEAPLGIVYQSDAATDKNVKIVATFPDSSHPRIVYPIAILTSSTNVLAAIYVQYLLSGKSTPFFEDKGFVILP